MASTKAGSSSRALRPALEREKSRWKPCCKRSSSRDESRDRSPRNALVIIEPNSGMVGNPGSNRPIVQQNGLVQCPFGQKTQTRLCRAVLIVFQQSAQPLSASNLPLLPDHRQSRGRKEQQVVFNLMIPLLVIKRQVVMQSALERALAKQDRGENSAAPGKSLRAKSVTYVSGPDRK